MTNSTYTHVAVVLDRSGSMETVRSSTISGFNEFINKQKLDPGKTTLSLMQFDTEFDTIYSDADIKRVKELTIETFVPRGGTALHDAIGRTINNVGASLSLLSEQQRPGKVLVVIITDGQENSSREFTCEQIKQMITHQRDKYSWEFVFIGANQDAVLTATTFGISGANALNYTSNDSGTRSLYASLSANTTAFKMGTKATMDWSEADKKAQETAKS